MSEVTVCCKDKASDPSPCSSVTLICQMVMMGCLCPHKQPVCLSLTALHHLTGRHGRTVASHDVTHALLYTCSNFSTTFRLHSSCLFFFNSSLFSTHVYFYPSVHGRSHRNDEAWETCSSPWQLYCKPSLSNIGFSSMLYTFVALILLSDLFRSIFHTVSSPDAQ